MSISLIPETAPFDAEQRAWLNGFFAGLLGIEERGAGDATRPPADAGSASVVFAPPAAEPARATEHGEDFPWHDAALSMGERLALARDRPLERRLMAAMAQLDCGACGYLCRTYSEAIARGEEKNLTLCAPGGRETTKALRTILKAESPGESDARERGASGPGPPPMPAVSRVPARPRVEESAGSPGHSRQNPFHATVVSSTNLNKEGSAKETRHVVIDLSGSDLTYSIGDALGVYPTNCPELVDQIIRAMRAGGSERIPGGDGAPRTLREELLNRNLRDVDEELALLVAESANGSGPGLRALAQDEDLLAGFDVLDLLEMGGTVPVDAERFVSELAPLAPRLYSIASSPRAQPGRVHLTVAKATTMARQRLRRGVASTMFAERLSPGDRVPVFVQPSQGFRLPADPARPIIMVGPGTGVAPFRGFLQERQVTGATGDAWLFFGDQRRETDFLYEDEVSAYLSDGTLTRLDTAFSRDQAKKVYVQDRMREKGAELFRWLERGACFYVCGDARRMAADVDRTLRELVGEHGGMSRERAGAYVADLVRAGRYLRDVY